MKLVIVYRAFNPETNSFKAFDSNELLQQYLAENHACHPGGNKAYKSILGLTIDDGGKIVRIYENGDSSDRCYVTGLQELFIGDTWDPTRYLASAKTAKTPRIMAPKGCEVFLSFNHVDCMFSTGGSKNDLLECNDHCNTVSMAIEVNSDPCHPGIANAVAAILGLNDCVGDDYCAYNVTPEQLIQILGWCSAASEEDVEQMMIFAHDVCRDHVAKKAA